jgi:hypothetical protein
VSSSEIHSCKEASFVKNHRHPETPGSGGGFNARRGLFFATSAVLTFQNVSLLVLLAQEVDFSRAPRQDRFRCAADFARPNSVPTARP